MGLSRSTTESVTPETEFVLGLLRRIGNADEVDARLCEIAAAGPDWDVILDLVARHRLCSVLKHAFNEAAITAPDEVVAALSARKRETAVANLGHSRQLYDIVELFGENDIAALPYKGPVLAAEAYGSVGDRSFGDLDLLVAADEVAAACDLLEQRGYRRINFADVPVDRLVDGTVFRWGKEFRFVDPDGGLPVELRFGFIGGSRSDTEIFSDFWERRTPTSLTGRSLSVLSPEDRALLLLVHGTKHGWRRLSWVYDVALVCRQDVDWDAVLARAERYSWLRAVLYGIGVLTELTGLSAPTAVRPRLESSRLCSWGAKQTAARLRRDLTADLTNLEPITTAIFLNDGMSGVVADGIDEVLAPRKADHEWVTLSPRLYPLYYLVRPFHLLFSTIKRVVGR
ncbi:hypothetical protein EXE41_06265 [Halorubrum sp. SD690R]|nr:hypothetical protein EXE41_06265 [Halorubrum sp. SD690R]